MDSNFLNGKQVANIMVIGVGGGGNNAVTRMVKSGLEGATFAAVNTDQLCLDTCAANPEYKITLGKNLTKGLGAGANPEIGEKAAEETKEEIKKLIEGVDMLFITAGMGGGTGTGAAPVIAQLAHEMQILTIAVVTKPFRFEGRRRAINAEMGIAKMRDYVDTLLVVPNDKLLEVYPDGSMQDNFLRADEVLRNAVMGITDIITKPSMINVDFADVKAVMEKSGLAHLGIGRANIDDPDAVLQAVKNAVASPLLETNIRGAKRLIVNFLAPGNMPMQDVNEALELLNSVIDKEANIIFGCGFSSPDATTVDVILIATGFDGVGLADIPSQQVGQVEEPVVKATVQNNSLEANVSQAQSTQSAKSDFETWAKNHPAFKDMCQAGWLYIVDVEAKVKAYQAADTPKFIKIKAAEELSALGIKVELL